MTDIFNISFEDNDLIHPTTGFDRVDGRGGTFEITAAAAAPTYGGSYGLAYTPASGYKMYGLKNFPVVKRFRTAIWFSQNTYTVNDGSYVQILYQQQYSTAFSLRLSRSGSTYRFNVTHHYDTGSNNGDYYTIDTGWHLVEIDWKASSAPGANDGHVHWWIDGSEKTQRNSIDNDTKFILGSFIGTYSASDHPGSSGTMYFDSWRANNDGSEIGD